MRYALAKYELRSIQSLSCYPRKHTILFLANLQGTSIMAPLQTEQCILKMESIELYTLSAMASLRHSGIPILSTHTHEYAQIQGNRTIGEYIGIGKNKKGKIHEQTLAMPKRENKQYLMDKCRFSAEPRRKENHRKKEPTHSSHYCAISPVRTLVKIREKCTR